ncbi:MAG: hypothetical protein NC420_08815 [Eubacterium sp.]|nr:hypothetical protein [Eubacterium sp.]
MENNVTDPVMRKLMKELKITRIVCMFSSLLTLCLLAGGILLFGRVQELAEVCRPVVEKVSQLDVDAINSAIEGLDTAELTQALKTLNDAVEKIGELSDKLGDVVSWLSGLFH